MAKEEGITKNQILSELSRSAHGALADYVPTCLQAAEQDAEFLAHLIAWNYDKGQIRDSKVALPVVSSFVNSFNDDFLDNSYAHFALLNPREMLKGYRFALSLRDNKELSPRIGGIKNIVRSKLRLIEDNGFDRI